MIGLFGGMTTPVVEYKAAALAGSLALKAVLRSSIRRLMLSTSVLSKRGPELPEHAALMMATITAADKSPLRMVSLVSQYPNASPPVVRSVWGLTRGQTPTASVNGGYLHVRRQTWRATCHAIRAWQTMPGKSSENTVKISRAPSSSASGTQFLIDATARALEKLTSSRRSMA